MMENEFIMMENDNNFDNDKVNNHIHFSVISFLYHLIMFPIFSLLCTIPVLVMTKVNNSAFTFSFISLLYHFNHVAHLSFCYIH